MDNSNPVIAILGGDGRVSARIAEFQAMAAGPAETARRLQASVQACLGVTPWPHLTASFPPHLVNAARMAEQAAERLATQLNAVLPRHNLPMSPRSR